MKFIIQVIASNLIGAELAVAGYPNATANSLPSNEVAVTAR
jgi:hypothetical protein